MASLVLSVVVVGVTEQPASATACATASLDAWDGDCNVVASPAGVVHEQLTYPSPVPGAPPIRGYACRPVAVGTYPLLVINHAADVNLWDVGSLTYNWCDQYAAAGYAVIGSQYRDEDAEDAFCKGEVDDVVAMVDRARGLPWVDDDHIAMQGVSLGGCVTLKIHQQGMTGLEAAVAVAPPTDMAAVYTNAVTQYAHFSCVFLYLLHPNECAGWKAIRDVLNTATGGPPGVSTQAEYDARSPLEQASDTAASSVPLLIAQGGADVLIPLAQTCAFAAAVNSEPAPALDFQAVRYGPGGSVTSTPPTGCSGLGTWASASPSTFSGDRYFLEYDDAEHVGSTTAVMLTKANSFFLEKVAPGP